MGIFFAVVFMSCIVALGMGSIKDFVTRKKKSSVEPVNRNVYVEPVEKPTTPSELLLKALHNEGYLGLVKLKDEDLFVVRNPVIGMMVSEIASSPEELMWLVPELGLRLRPSDEYPTVKNDYDWCLLTNTHAIPFNF